MSAIYFLHHDSAVVLTADDLVDDYLFQDNPILQQLVPWHCCQNFVSSLELKLGIISHRTFLPFLAHVSSPGAQ